MNKAGRVGGRKAKPDVNPVEDRVGFREAPESGKRIEQRVPLELEHDEERAGDRLLRDAKATNAHDMLGVELGQCAALFLENRHHFGGGVRSCGAP